MAGLFDLSGLASSIGKFLAGPNPYIGPQGYSFTPNPFANLSAQTGANGLPVGAPITQTDNPFANAPQPQSSFGPFNALPYTSLTDQSTGLMNTPAAPDATSIAPLSSPVNVPSLAIAGSSPQIPSAAKPTSFTPSAQPQQSQENPFLSALSGSNFSAGLHNLANGFSSGTLFGGLAGLADAGQGFATGLRTDPQGLMLMKAQLTARALMERNPKLTPTQALAMAFDPAMLANAIKPQTVAPGGSLVTPIDIMGGGGNAASGNSNGVFQNKNGILNKDTLTTLADQYISGDKSVLQNLGRTAAGAINVAALRQRITERMQERGISPQEQAVRMAEFQGLESAQKTLGTRQATIGMAGSEVQKLAPLVLQASSNVDRTRFPALNSIILAGQKGRGDPNVVRLGQSINSLINAYARAINPNGLSTVSDKDHARELLSGAWSQGQIQAGVDQMLSEIAAAKQAPGVTKQEIRELYSSPRSGPPPQGGVVSWQTYFGKQ